MTFGLKSGREQKLKDLNLNLKFPTTLWKYINICMSILSWQTVYSLTHNRKSNVIYIHITNS